MKGAHASRIMPAEQVRALGTQAVRVGPRPRLGLHDLDNEAAQAAYVLGRRRGFEAGERAGFERAHREFADQLAGAQAQAQAARQVHAEAMAQALRGPLAQFRARLDAAEGAMAEELVGLALDLARAVIRRECATPAEALLPAVREAVAALGSAPVRARVRVAPADVAPLRAALDQGRAAPGGDEAAAFDLLADAGLGPGSCIVDSDVARVDASLRARWDAALARLGMDSTEAPWMDETGSTR